MIFLIFVGKKCDSNLRCLECPDGSAVDAIGRCPTTSCSSVHSCERCDVGGKCGWCKRGKKLAADQMSCFSSGDCGAGAGWKSSTFQYQCLYCDSNTKCKNKNLISQSIDLLGPNSTDKGIVCFICFCLKAQNLKKPRFLLFLRRLKFLFMFKPT